MKLIQLSNLPSEHVSHDPAICKRTMLRNGEAGALTHFAAATIPPGLRTSPHAHADMVEVFFVRAGSGRVFIDGVPHPLASGSCIRIDPGEVHVLENDGAVPLELLYFGVTEGGGRA